MKLRNDYAKLQPLCDAPKSTQYSGKQHDKETSDTAFITRLIIFNTILDRHGAGRTRCHQTDLSIDDKVCVSGTARKATQMRTTGLHDLSRGTQAQKKRHKSVAFLLPDEWAVLPYSRSIIKRDGEHPSDREDLKQTTRLQQELEPR